MSLELWLFAVVMEVIVLGTFGGGMFMMYRTGKRQSGALARPDRASAAAVPAQEGVLGRPTDAEARPSAAA
jgi:hypothetical protein